MRMAHARTDVPSRIKDKTETDCQTTDDKTDVPDCAVCLQPCMYPACLPCRHVFCYLCIKGVANQSKRCPMCRDEIPPDFLEHPQLMGLEETEKLAEIEEEEYGWYYEGRDGWWQYDSRTSMELETAYKQRNTSCELLIAGVLYVINFQRMSQQRLYDFTRRRQIKRDLLNVPKKGVAGLRLTAQEDEENIREIRGAERSVSPTNIDSVTT